MAVCMVKHLVASLIKQILKRQEEFRRYYNRSIYPELARLEQKRRRLLVLLFTSVFLFTGIVVLQFYLDIFLVSLVLAIPIALYISFLLYEGRNFVATFKPRIVNLILEFMGGGEFVYEPKNMLPKEVLRASRLFVTDAPFYEGEDYIKGKIGEVDFELCEMNVREFSPVRNRLNYVFKGVFLHAVFPRKATGKVLVLPARFSQYLVRTVKSFSREGGKADRFRNQAFNSVFNIYATEETYLGVLLSEEVQAEILAQHELGKEIYLSFIDGEMFVAVTEPRDILEPRIFLSNLSYELVREFYEDIDLLLNIVEDFDRNH
jgi:hypothetical protein